ncbi:MAG: SMP-30/gluconolactonase/LRE family protein [Chloroflexi bacterium]|nr:SMP-30/gluconolactonase/LRE family protein [Chloroflexota bacterium]
MTGGRHDRTTFDIAVAGSAEVGEGPIWDDVTGELLWVDIPAGLIHRWRPGTTAVSTIVVGQPVGAIALRRSGGLVAAVRDGFALIDQKSGKVELRCPVEIDRVENRMNDGKCDGAGRFWAGTMALDSRPGVGSLYRLDPDLTVTTILTEVSISNGLGWAPDDRTMYFVDSPAQAIDAFDFDAERGLLSNRRRLAAIEVEAGMPDGLTVDSAGFVWVALWGGGAIRRYSPTGDLVDTVRLPATQLTSCTFGGPERRDLYVTSASRGLSAGERRRQPHAGAVFRVRLHVPGHPVARFGG